jgi:hypothetical protein
MPFALNVRRGFFPLDEELQLLPGHLTPSVQEGLVHLSTWMPFARAVKELRFFTHVTTTEPTVRRETAAAGAAYVAVQTEEVERLERELPAPPDGPPLQLLSVDGAFVPLVHKEWAEVKTLVIGTVEPPVLEKGEWVVHSTDLSYFSRLTDAETFGRLALVETHRRGTETAQQVCAVTDGAEWEQGFVNLHRCDATRILDFGHSSGYVAAAGQAVLGEGTEATKDWLKATLHELKHGQPATVLMTLRDMYAEMSARGADAATGAHTIQKSLDYLEKRQGHIEYVRFQALGYPIGSGSVESANKLVVEARLKGAGMHWAPVHVNPMLALRNIACSDRWEEAWPQITQRLRQEARAVRLHRHEQRVAKRLSAAPVAVSAPQGVASSSLNMLIAPVVSLLTTGEGVPPPEDSIPKKPYRPAADHPWRRSPIGRARFKPSRRSGEAKL